MTIGVPDSARISLQTSMPSFPGSIRSRSTTSGRNSRYTASAWSPVAHTRDSNPSLRSTIVSISASAGSSSTTRTRPLPDDGGWSVTVVLRLERAVALDAEVRRLVVPELGQPDPEGREVEPRDLLVEVL